MADFITLDGKKYKVADLAENSWAPLYKRQKRYDVGLTGKTLIQDFTRSAREPLTWQLTLRVFISTPWPDNTFGVWTDLLAASRKTTVTYIEHDGVTTHTVGILPHLSPRPRVGANVLGECYGIFFVNVTLTKVYQ